MTGAVAAMGLGAFAPVEALGQPVARAYSGRLFTVTLGGETALGLQAAGWADVQRLSVRWLERPGSRHLEASREQGRLRAGAPLTATVREGPMALVVELELDGARREHRVLTLVVEAAGGGRRGLELGGGRVLWLEVRPG